MCLNRKIVYVSAFVCMICGCRACFSCSELRGEELTSTWEEVINYIKLIKNLIWYMVELSAGEASGAGRQVAVCV